MFAAALALLLPTDVRAERVGFKFEGALQGGSTGTYTLFGISVPRNSPVVGTFAYDTTVPGIDGDPGVRTFAQSIEGGYSLKIFSTNGDILLSASDYVVTVADDFERQTSPETVDLFSVDFKRFDPANDPPILVNGAPWPTIGFIKVEFSWPQETFNDPNEPVLASDRPLVPGAFSSAFVGSSFTPRFFSIDSISAIDPPTGDYNVDSAVDSSDYVEWRRAFDGVGEPFQHADGNEDGVVDAADYVVWRRALGSNNDDNDLMNLPATVPEPAGLVAVLAALVLFAARRRRTIPCHRLNAKIA